MKPLTQLKPCHKKCVELMAQHPDYPLTKIAELMERHYQTIYQWTRDPLFQEELDKELHKTFQAGASIALGKILHIIETGRDTDALNASKFILENTGYKVDDNINISSNDGFTINIKNNKNGEY